MPSEIEDLLIVEAGITPDEAKEIAPYVTSYQAPERQAELEALKRSVGGVIICTKPRNLVFNWKDYLTNVGLNFTVAAASLNPLGLIGAGLKSLGDLRGAMKVQLSDRHAKVVEALWLKNPDANPVTINDIQAHLPNDDRADLDGILQDLSTLFVIRQEDGRIRKLDKLILQ